MFTKKSNLVVVRIMFVAVLIIGGFGVNPVQATGDTEASIAPLISSTVGGWNALGNNGLDGVVNAIAFKGNYMYAGGYFSQTSDGAVTGLTNIAKYDMTTETWSALPHGGLNGSVHSITIHGDDMYVGGVFEQTMDGAVTDLSQIAKFDTVTNTWSSLPRGGLFGGVVRAIAINGDYLYAGGAIVSTADFAVQAYHIIRLNLTTDIWTALPHGGLDDEVRVISFKGDDMYVGGSFYKTYDSVVTGLTGIAKFDTTTNTWSALSHDGIRYPPVYAIVFDGDDMYVGGAFSRTWDEVVTNLNHIARYDTSTDTWYGFPHNGLNGLNNYVGALAILDGDLFMGGYFSQTNDGVITNLNYVAKYDIATGVWSTMPHNGLNNPVTTIVPHDGNIYLGGNFTKVNDLSLDLNRIAAYGVCVPGPITVQNLNDSGVGSLRQAIAEICSGDTIYFNINGTIFLNSPLPDIDKTLTINGSGQIIAIDGGNNYGIFKVTSVGDFTAKNMTIQNGNAASCNFGSNRYECGGAIYNNGKLTVVDSTFTGNSTTHGGAIFIDSGISNIASSTFISNSATYGGGVFIWTGSLNITNSTFYGNSAEDAGGGLYNSAGTLTITNNTISNNSAVEMGGGIFHGNGSLNLINTIVANSALGNDCHLDGFAGEITTNINNIVMNNAPSPNGCGTPIFTDNPLLGILQDNGGSTQTMALLPGSPAIDASDDANCPAADQRGVTRPQGSHCDIGAYELVDTIVPEVSSITRAGVNPTDTSSVDFTVTFSEPVSGVDATDFALTTTGVTGTSITNVSGSGDTCTVTVNTGSGNGTIRLDVVDDNSIVDAASNPLGGVGVGDGNFMSGEGYTIIKTVTPTFGDVPFSHPYSSEIEILYANGYTAGCSTVPLNFCPDISMSRAQSAVFMLRGNFGNTYVPVTPSHFFADNWKNSSWGEGWAESMYLEGLTAGCSPSPLKFCPDEILTNVQLAVFGLRLKYGMAYSPPAAQGTVFADMTDVGFWGTGWAEQAYADGLIPSCGTDGGTGKPKFCPNNQVSRGFGAYVIVNAKGLTMP